MRSKLRRGFAAIAAIALAVTLLAVSLSSPFISTTADFSIFNSGWNGTSKLAIVTYQAGKFAPSFQVRSSGTDLTVEQTSLDKLSLVPATDALIEIGPTKPFTAAEGRLVGDFVRGGGTLLLSDDFGTANSLLIGMNATSRFSGKLLMDLAYEKQPEFSVCFDVSPDAITRNVTTFLLNYPSSITAGPSTQVLARSSVASWLDTNGDRLQEWGEPRGPFPLLVKERLGGGTIVLLSDPSVLINGMSKNLDNSVLAKNLIGFVSLDRSLVYFDESHRNFFNPVEITMQFSGYIPDSAKAGLVALAFLLGLWVSTDLLDNTVGWVVRKTMALARRMIGLVLALFSRTASQAAKEPEPLETVVSRTMKEHPEWRVGLVRYLLREKERHEAMLKQGRS